MSPKSSLTGSRQLKGPLFFLVTALLLFLLVCNAVALGWQIKKTWHIRRPSYSYVNDDMPRNFELPDLLRTVNMKFEDFKDHYALRGHQSSVEWNEIRPNGRGFAFLGDSYYAFEPSVWHQTHCLNHIRTILLLGEDTSDHTEHCFHYLRQGILCGADITLEYGGSTLPNGNNVTHTCSDWKQGYDHLEERFSRWSDSMRTRWTEVSDGTNSRPANGMNVFL